MSLVARHLEANGIPTVCVGSAHDILAAGRPPRACFVDYPLGHTAGRPFDVADQDGIVLAALQTLVTASAPDTLVTLPNRWPDDAWRSEASSTEARDTRQPRDETPQFQHPADRIAALASGALRDWRESGKPRHESIAEPLERWTPDSASLLPGYEAWEPPAFRSPIDARSA